LNPPGHRIVNARRIRSKVTDLPELTQVVGLDFEQTPQVRRARELASRVVASGRRHSWFRLLPRSESMRRKIQRAENNC
jgi:hypothetical protein